MTFFDLPDGLGWEIGLIPVPVIQVHVVNETSGKPFIRNLLIPLEFGRGAVLAARDSAAAEIDPDAEACGIHDFDSAREVLGSAIDVLVQINDAMLAAPFFSRVV